ncbi:MAG: hypothetical protein AAGE52_05450 [Myxococcota bacterium]
MRTAALCVLVAMGCAETPAPPAPLGSNNVPRRAGGFVPGLVEETEPIPTGSIELRISETWLQGEVADVSSAGGEGRVANAYQTGDRTYFDTRIDGVGGAFMHAFSIRNLEELPEGTYTVLTATGTGISTAVGCSGRVDGRWDADIPAEQIDIQVEDEGDQRTLTVTSQLADFYGGTPQRVTTRIAYERGEIAAP